MTQQDKLITKSSNLFIDADASGQRIDNFFFNKLKNIPKSRIYRMLRSGEIRVNKGRIEPSYKLKPNDLIRVPPFWNKTSQKGKPGSNLINLLLGNIIFEDDKILVINKPTGIASHGGSGINFGVIEILRAARPDIRDLELVHRLDRDTSGCIILAKKRSVLRQLHELIRSGGIFKKYLLLVRRQWKNGEHIVDAPLLKNQLSSGERIVTVTQAGKTSLTIFRPVRVSAEMSLLEAELKTGRTHQIRAHASHIGYPIAGDEKYGDKEFNRKMSELGLKRLFLHAKELQFAWPDGAKVNFVASLDQQLKKIIEQFSY
jgi:23S rRNA pseudouridine955/2504/2580 synthase